ncbi:MAG: zf-HC2 domain-containing protein [Nitrospirae bacterium]|nr:zf-HC2 domain-containing protein [Nitrospirota bacterium]
MDCKEIQDKLSAYIDRELAPAEEERIRLHLDVCGTCTARYAMLLQAWQALDAWQDVAPPDRMRTKILASVRPQRRETRFRAALSVAAALLLVFGLAFYYFGQKSGSMQHLADSQTPVQTAVGDVSEEEIMANLPLLQEDDFIEALDELVRIDDLPLAEEPSNSIKEPERSSLNLVVT